MTRASLGRFFAGAVCAVGFAVSSPVFGQAGASITIVGPGCTQWQLGGTPPNQTLTCVSGPGSSTAPVCTISGPTSGVTGTPLPLFAKCVPEATSYMWTSTGVTCKGSGQATCYANEAAGTYTYTVTGSNGAGTGPVSPNFGPVTFAAAPPPAPTGCVFSAKSPASGSLATAGGAISMTATCSGTVTSWNWTKNAVGWANDGATGSSTKGDNLPANAGSGAVNYAYTAQACNGPSCAAPIATAFSVAAASGGGGGGPISCPGYSNPIVVNVGWASVGAGVVQMGASDAAVLILTVPSGVVSTGAGLFSYYDQFAVGSNRQVAISNNAPCAWAGPFADPYNVSGSSYSWALNVGTGASGYGNLYLTAGTYYISIRNLTCAASPFCDFGYQFTKPPGT